MAADKPISLQDNFLNAVRRSKTSVTIFLMKGVKLQGIVTWFDAFSVLLRRDGAAQLVYKHAISTIMPTAMPDLPDLKAGVVDGTAGRRAPLQDLFLTAAEREEMAMTMFLVNGVMLQGTVTAHDQFSLLLERGDQGQLVYKHAVSTMQPNGPMMIDPQVDPPEGNDG